MTLLRQAYAEFHARGGLWVVAQLVMIAIAAALPMWQDGTPAAATGVWRPVGWMLIAFGGGLFVLGAAALGQALTPFPKPRADAGLKTDGVYRWVRHPIYSGLLAAAFGWSLVHLSLTGVMFDLVLFVFFDRKAAREERWLLEVYPYYARYRERVKKLIPGVY